MTSAASIEDWPSLVRTAETLLFWDFCCGINFIPWYLTNGFSHLLYSFLAGLSDYGMSDLFSEILHNTTSFRSVFPRFVTEYGLERAVVYKLPIPAAILKQIGVRARAGVTS